jgi:hypothetical protein
MNNWDVDRPKITVVFGAPDVPDSAVQEVVKEAMELRGYTESGGIKNEGSHENHIQFYTMGEDKLDDEHVRIVINSLEDHILNTKPDDWLDHQHDLLVDEKEWLWVDVAWGTYYGPNCTVDTWFVTI